MPVLDHIFIPHSPIVKKELLNTGLSCPTQKINKKKLHDFRLEVKGTRLMNGGLRKLTAALFNELE